MPNINFYDVNKEYIQYLKMFDSKIPNIDYSKHEKFVCGIVLQINGFNYFAPIPSFNKQQKTNILILNENGNPISSIRFSFMFPAPDEVLYRKDFLLLQEYRFCNKNKDAIYKKARYVYKRVVSGHDEFMTNLCCNFKLLETKCAEYEMQKDMLSEVAATNEEE